MEFALWTKGFPTLAVDCLVVGVFEEAELGAEARAVDAACGGRLQRLLARGDFTGRAGDTLLLTEVTELPARRVLLVGLGARAQLTRRGWRRALGNALTALGRTRIASVALGLDRPAARELDDYYFGRAVAEVAGATLYRINDLKTGKKPPAVVLKKVLAGPVRKADAATRGFKHGAAIAAAAAVQRNLANLPPNVCTPIFLAEEARALAKRQKSVSAKVLDEPA